MTVEEVEALKPLERICAGSTYGTAKAISAYLQLMSDDLTLSNNECNDQAWHIYDYYTGKLQNALDAADAGRVELQPHDAALVGTIGTTPYVRYNEWGEVLSKGGEIQHVVHQFKHHAKLQSMVKVGTSI